MGSSDAEHKEIVYRFFSGFYLDLDRPDDLYCMLKPELPALRDGTSRVTDGARTHNHWSHNPVLYH